MFSLITSPGGDSPTMSPITNETLAALLQANHVDMSRRIDALTDQVRETNGRLRAAESKIAVLEDRPSSRSRPALSGIVVADPELSVKRLSAWIAGGLVASWGAVKLIWMVGDWLQKAGLR
jgi:hypothetical protein